MVGESFGFVGRCAWDAGVVLCGVLFVDEVVDEVGDLAGWKWRVRTWICHG